MFSDLPKLFGRDFVVGFLLPAALFAAVNVGAAVVLGTDAPQCLARWARQSTAQATAPTDVWTWGDRIAVSPLPTPAAPGVSKPTPPPVQTVWATVIVGRRDDWLAQRPGDIVAGDLVLVRENAGLSASISGADVRIVPQAELLAHVPNGGRRTVSLAELFGLANAGVLAGLMIITWLLGVCLLFFNHGIYGMKEGYFLARLADLGRLSPFRLCGWRERCRFSRQTARLKVLSDKAATGQINPEEQSELSQLASQIPDRFPDQAMWLLPTKFGNCIRAFEVYPRVMYGIDSIPGWDRLLLILPDKPRETIEAAKAQVDCWVNLWLLSLALTMEAAAFWLIMTRPLSQTWYLLLVPFAFALFASGRACSSAVAWGAYIKAAFDVYLPSLRKQLGFEHTQADEFDLWADFSQAILYCKREFLPTRDGKVNDEGAACDPAAQALFQFYSAHGERPPGSQTAATPKVAQPAGPPDKVRPSSHPAQSESRRGRRRRR